MGLGSRVRTMAPVRISASSEPGAEESGCGRRINPAWREPRRLQNGGGVPLSEPWSCHLLNAGIGQEWFLTLAFRHSHSLVLPGFVTKDIAFPHVGNYMCVTYVFRGQSALGPHCTAAFAGPFCCSEVVAPEAPSPRPACGQERSAPLRLPVVLPS